MRNPQIAAILAAALLAGCAAGPNYRRPNISAPASFRSPTPASNESSSIGDLHWWEIFKDERLQDLERIALEQNNYDLRAAVTRVEAARATVGIVRAQQYPNLAADANISTIRSSRNGQLALSPAFVPSQNRTFGAATLQLLSFEIDIWGRLRRASEAARAQLLAADETRKAVVTTLVSDVATAYFNLRELDAELDIAQRTLATRQESLKLIRNRQTGG